MDGLDAGGEDMAAFSPTPKVTAIGAGLRDEGMDLRLVCDWIWHNPLAAGCVADLCRASMEAGISLEEVRFGNGGSAW
jgi:hypothetical protein